MEAVAVEELLAATDALVEPVDVEDTLAAREALAEPVAVADRVEVDVPLGVASALPVCDAVRELLGVLDCVAGEGVMLRVEVSVEVGVVLGEGTALKQTTSMAESCRGADMREEVRSAAGQETQPIIRSELSAREHDSAAHEETAACQREQ